MIDIKLSYPGRMARYFIESRLTTLMILSLLFIGFIGLNYTPREENPQIIVPAVEITVPMQDTAPTGPSLNSKSPSLQHDEEQR